MKGPLEAKPQVAASTNFYLSHVNEVIEEVGNFPLTAKRLNEAKQAWLGAEVWTAGINCR